MGQVFGAVGIGSYRQRPQVVSFLLVIWLKPRYYWFMSAKKKINHLYKDPSTAMFGGVASGLAQYLDVDPVLVRIGLFLMLFPTGGLILLIYSGLWWLLPSSAVVSKIEDAEVVTPLNKDLPERKLNLGGAFLMLVGVYFLMKNFGWLEWLDLSKLWPVALIVLGVLLLRK